MALTILVMSATHKLSLAATRKAYSTLVGHQSKSGHSFKSFVKGDSILKFALTSSGSLPTRPTLGNLCSKCHHCFSRTAHNKLTVGRGRVESRWTSYQNLSFFGNNGHRLGKLNNLHVRRSNTNSKAANSGNGKAKAGKRPMPQASEVKRLLLLAKPEKWKLTGWFTWSVNVYDKNNVVVKCIRDNKYHWNWIILLIKNWVLRSAIKFQQTSTILYILKHIIPVLKLFRIFCISYNQARPGIKLLQYGVINLQIATLFEAYI